MGGGICAEIARQRWGGGAPMLRWIPQWSFCPPTPSPLLHDVKLRESVCERDFVDTSWTTTRDQLAGGMGAEKGFRDAGGRFQGCKASGMSESASTT